MTGTHRNVFDLTGDLGGRRRWTYPRGPVALRESWRAGATAAGWSHPGDWWAPAVDELAAALCAGPAGDAGAVPACARLGRARAEAGVGLTEALDDLCLPFGLVPAGTPPLPAVRAFVESWADVWLRDLPSAGCVDPLTQLTTPAYLRTRLAELYRAATVAGPPVTDRYALLVVVLGTGDGWRLLVRQLAVAESLRAAFPGGETLTALSRYRCGALVPRTAETVDALDRLRAAMAERLGPATTRTWLARLPDRPSDVPDALADLTESADPSGPTDQS